MSATQGQAFEDLRNTLSECARIVRRRWRLCTVVLSLVGSTAFWLSQHLPREYAATTLFERRDDVVLQNFVHSNSPYSFEHLKTTMTGDMIGSRALLHGLTTIGLAPSDALQSSGALDETERELLNDLVAHYKIRPDVRLMHSSQTLDQVQLKCSANDPDVARRMVIALRDNYITESRQRMLEVLAGARGFFADEIARLESEVVQSDAALRDGFEELPGFDPSDLVSFGNRLEILRNQRDLLVQQKTALEAELGARRDFLKNLPGAMCEQLVARSPTETPATRGAPDVAAAPDTEDVRGVDGALDKAVDDVQRQLVDLITVRRMTVEHPQVRTLQARLDALESLRSSIAASQPKSTAAPVVAAETRSVADRHPEFKAQQVRVELEIDVFQKQLTLVESQLEQSENRLSRFERLYSRIASKDDNYRGLIERRTKATHELEVWQGHLANLERVLTAENGERGTQFSLIEEPAETPFPVRPVVASVFAGCSGLSLAAAGLLAALAELFDRSFRTAGQLSRSLGVPALACVGVIATPRERRRSLVRRLLWTPTLTLMLVLLMGSGWLAYASLRLPAVHDEVMSKFERFAADVGIVTPDPAGQSAPTEVAP